MAENSYRMAQIRVEGILRNLPTEDREVLDAFIADSRTEAARMRPVWDTARMLGIGLPLSLAVGASIFLVGPQLPSIYLPAMSECEECAECAVCPPPPPPLDWQHSANYEMRRATTDEMTCLWPDESWTFMCTIKVPTPSDMVESPVVVPQ